MAAPVPTYTGLEVAESSQGDYNSISFVVQQLLSRVSTMTLVRVVGVTATGEAIPAAYVDVQPMVNQLDGAGNAVPHGTIYGLPYFRLMAGTNAVIMDPIVGDIGIAGFASRDISSVKSTQNVSNPGSFRRFDMADGIYTGGVLGPAPLQFVAFRSTGIVMVSPQAITIQAPNIVLDGNVTSLGTFANNGHDIGSTHQHTGVQTGSGTTGPPQ